MIFTRRPLLRAFEKKQHSVPLGSLSSISNLKSSRFNFFENFLNNHRRRITLESVHCPVNGIILQEKEEIVQLKKIISDFVVSQLKNARSLEGAYIKYRQRLYGEKWEEEDIGPKHLYHKFQQNLNLKMSTFLYGHEYVKNLNAKQLVLCPIQGFIIKPRDTLFQALLRRYEIYDERKPLITKCSVAACCAFLGELVVQIMDENEDTNRLLALPIVNALWVGLGCSSWLKLMARMFPSSNCRGLKGEWKPILAKTALTTFFLNPLYVLTFMTGTHLLIMDKSLDNCSSDSESESFNSCDSDSVTVMESSDGDTNYLDDNSYAANTVETRKPKIDSDSDSDQDSGASSQFSIISQPKIDQASTLLVAGYISTPVIYAVQYVCVPEKLHIPYLCGINFLWSVFASKTTSKSSGSSSSTVDNHGL